MDISFSDLGATVILCRSKILDEFFILKIPEDSNILNIKTLTFYVSMWREEDYCRDGIHSHKSTRKAQKSKCDILFKAYRFPRVFSGAKMWGCTYIYVVLI